MMPNFLKTLETLMELPDLFMGNEELESFVKRMERETGIEPATPSLGSSYSTN